MKALLSAACAAALIIGSVAPLQAAPLQVLEAISPASPETIQVQNRSQMEFGDRGWRNHRWHRGSRQWDQRHGKWRHRDRGDDLAIGLGAFAAGAILGGVLNSGPRVVYRERYRGVSSAHVEWCYNRYRSYRAYDNTFQPYHGPRRQCYSPYS